MDILVSTASSLVLRYVLSNVLQPYRPSMVIPVFLGLWEGTWLHMLSSSMPASYDPYLAYLLRPLVDFTISGSFSYVFIIVSWSILTVLALDAMGPEHFYDTRLQRDSKRPTRMGSSHTMLHAATHSPQSRRRSRSRSLTFILPTSPESATHTPSSSRQQSQSSAITSNSSSTTPTGVSPTPRFDLTPQQQPIAPIESLQMHIPSQVVIANTEPLPNPVSSPISSIPLLQTPVGHRIELVVPVLTEGSRSTFPRSPFPPSTSTPTQISNTDPTPREQADPDRPIPVPAPSYFPTVALQSNLPTETHYREAPVVRAQNDDDADPLQTPVLRGFDDPVHVDSDFDELTTPPYMRPPRPAFISHGGPTIIEDVPTAGPSLLLKVLSTTIDPSTSNVTTSATPVPIPPPGPHLQLGSPALSALDVLSPASPASSMAGSIISTTDPKILFERAEKLRNRAWQEVQEKTRLKSELQKARNEGKKKDIFILAGDVKECEHRIDTLHARAKRRYYLGDVLANTLMFSMLTVLHIAKNTEEMGGDEIDVHGLFVEEAVDATEAAFRKALKDGKESLRVIVGRGNHSKEGTPKLKPAVTAAMKKLSGMDFNVLSTLGTQEY
ncbi:hypothetical protein E1B28_000757 [Marasmius oreades]|uniref:Smr domain-containing protein n=1 Tax=Marasmius oreades TaxID=181124 RepID=A0A9P7V238_9AGAR|nr:uncharacterized protein E1B28_000757 [Marasmius oreades]KAG7098854.1 hypothetical protein E1B28_000757 [Marasmius oreades]